MPGVVRNEEQLRTAAHEVAADWIAFVQAAHGLAGPEVDDSLARALGYSVPTLDRSLIFFLCGGEGGGRDRRDIQPRDFLGFNWFPEEEMDQRLRGRLGVISKGMAHLSWRRVEDDSPIVWPYTLLVWETSWSMNSFISALENADSPHTPVFKAVRDRVTALLPPSHQLPTVDHRVRRTAPGTGRPAVL